MLNSWRDKILPYITGKYTDIWLFVISFTESSFFLIPPDFFLLPAVLRKPERWLSRSVLVTAASVLGAIFGYVIGAVFYEFVGQPIVRAYSLEEELQRVAALFKENAFWTIFAAAFTPIPYKVFTIAGGLFRVDILIFILASLLGRGLRFLAIGYLAKVFGERYGYAIIRHFNIFTLFFAVVIVIYIILQIIQ